MIVPGVWFCNQHSWSKTMLPLEVCCISVLMMVLKAYLLATDLQFWKLAKQNNKKEIWSVFRWILFPIHHTASYARTSAQGSWRECRRE